MNDIDTMDMLGFFKVRAWDATRVKAANTPKRRYIDEIWPKRQ